MLKAVLFDFHNTLVSCDQWLQLEIRLLPSLALRRLFDEGVVAGVDDELLAESESLFRKLRQGVRESGVEISAFDGSRAVLDAIGVPVEDETLERIVRELEEECLFDAHLIDGASRAVWGLRRSGFRLGVVSSAGYPPFVEIALERFGLLTAFDVVVTSAGEGIYKSDPEIFHRATARLGVQSQEAVHVGDHAIYDVATAKRAGLRAIWFAGEAERTAGLHGISWQEAARAGEGADAVITQLDDLYEALLAFR